MTRTVHAAVVLAVLIVATPACGQGTGRDDARDRLIDQMVGNDLGRDVAECVVDAFFAERTDAELQAFIERDDLTDDERADFARLGAACTPD